MSSKLRSEYPSHRDVQKWMFESGFDGVPDPEKEPAFPDAKYMKLAARVADWVRLVQKANPQTELDWEALYQFPDAIGTVVDLMEGSKNLAHREMEPTWLQIEAWLDSAPTLSTSYHDHITFIAVQAARWASEQWFHGLKQFIRDNGGELEKNSIESVLDALESLIEVKEQVAAEAELPSHSATMTETTPFPMSDPSLSCQHDKDAKFLYLCKAEITVPVVGSSAEDALYNFETDFSDIAYDIRREVPQAVKTEVLDRVYHLAPDSVWHDYHPHGDYYGSQENCAYYTVAAHQKREIENDERRARVQKLISSLAIEDIELLKRELCSDTFDFT